MRLFGFGRQATESEFSPESGTTAVPATQEDRSMTPAEMRSTSWGLNFSFPGLSGHTRHREALGWSASWAAINILCQDVSKLPLHVYKMREDGGREKARGHPAHRVLRKPNPYQTRLELVRQWVLSLMVDGNAYGFMDRDASARPSAMYAVVPNRVQVLQDPRSLELFYRVGGNGIPEPDRPVVPQEDMAHFRWLSFDGIMGLSPITAARLTIETGTSLETHARNLFKNGARPAGVLKAPQRLHPETAKRLKESWQAAYGGEAGTGKTAILEEGLEWQQITFNSVDAQFLEQRKFAVTEIARIFRVPPHMLADLDKATYNNVEQAQAAYYRDTLMPILELLEATLNSIFGFDGETMFVEFDVSRLLRADTKARYDTHVSARQWGLKNANEIRAEEGLNPYEGGDAFLAPLNHGNAGDVGRQTPGEPKAPSAEDVRAATRKMFTQGAK